MNKKNQHTSQPETQRFSRWALYFLILSSGAAGLVYEVVWARQLTLFIGNTAIANAAVLTAFMAGLAAGSLVLGRMADRIERPLRLYALLEVLIGCYGATTPWLFDLLQAGYAQFAGVVGVSGAWSHIPRFLVAVVAMLIPTFLMGGTLPLLVKHFARRLDQALSVTSRIYGINTLGATIGAFSAGFLLLPNLGITDTLLSAAAVNILAGAGVYLLLTRTDLAPREKSEHHVAPAAGIEPVVLQQPGLLLAGFALSGFAALLYQIVWIQSLILIIGVSIYAFSTVLTVFLGGVGVGSLLAGRFLVSGNTRKGLKTAFYLQLGISLSAMVGLSLISQLPILFVQGWSLFHESFPLFQAYTFLLAAAVLFVPTLLLGALFPLVTGLWSNRKGAVGRGVGEAYGANAVGTIAGSAIGGLFILDWMGIEGSLYFASYVSMAVAALFWYLSSPERSGRYRWMPLPLTLAVLTVLVLVLPGWDRAMLQSQVFRQSARYSTEDVRAAIEKFMGKAEFLYYKEGIHGTVSVIRRVNSSGLVNKALLTNGKADASNSGDIKTQILLGQIPMFLHPAPQDVMVIGLGSGMTAGSVLRNDAVKNLDLLEISPEVVEASEYFKEDNYDVLDDPRTNLIIADARNYLLATRKKYDVIISEPSHSWVTGVSNLFTREFLQQAKKRLKDDGLLVQWYHLYGVDRGSLKALLQSMSDVFPYYTLWLHIGGDIIIVASNEPLGLDYRQQAQFFDSPKIKADLSRVGVASVEKMANFLLMSSSDVKHLLDGQQANTDENPVVEFNTPRHLYEPTVDDNIYMLFSALDTGEFRLPYVNLVEEQGAWIAVPFMGVRLNRAGGEFTEPVWSMTRKTEIEPDTGKIHLLGGMNGDMTLQAPWGEVKVHSTMGDRLNNEKPMLMALLDHDVPAAEQTFGGELKAGDIVVYWRVGRSAQPGRLNVVLARYCARKSKFDDWVSLTTAYPGNAENAPDAGAAVQRLNQLFRCLEE